MENIREQFKDFLLQVVLPQFKSYRKWINDQNITDRLDEIKNHYVESFNVDPFFVDLSDIDQEIFRITDNLNNRGGTPFNSFNNKAGSGIPNALLNTHFVAYLTYYNRYIQFGLFQDFVDKLHESLGTEFCGFFQRKRIELNGNIRVSSNSILYGAVRDNYWTINKGAERELQYHLFFDEERIGYGLGFNAQQSLNNLQPVENVTPYIQSYFNNEPFLKDLLNDYTFIESDEDVLRNISIGAFVQLGKTIPVTAIGEEFYQITGLDFLEILYDLKHKQFEAYQLIFNGRNQILTQQQNSMKEIEVLKYKKQVILQGAPGTGKTYSAKNMAEQMICGNVTADKSVQAERLENSERYKLVQFHPSYTYEDFVRGIVVESQEGQIRYTTQNKVLCKFAEKALKNYEDSLKPQDVLSREQWLDTCFTQFVDMVADQMENSEEDRFPLTPGVCLCGCDEGAFRYKGINGRWNTSGNRMLFKDIKQAWLDNNRTRQEVRQNPNLSGLAHHHSSYYIRVLNYFYEYLEANEFSYRPGETNTEIVLENYVLVIDEINRANLPAVLGELIYALEYRGEEVESMYPVEDRNKLKLPPNLYIIGTMNTADRSVGQIDYAIRRRFAFIDVEPKDLTEQLGDAFKGSIFQQVASLFTPPYLSPEFDRKDVQLGHSYFIEQEGVDFSIRLKYEIKPILREYIKDGILKEDARSIIENLQI